MHKLLLVFYNKVCYFCTGILFFLLLTPPVIFSNPVWNIRVFKPSDGLAHQVVRDIAQTPDGILWFATWGGGLSRYNGSDWKTYTVENGLADNMVRTLAVDHLGGLWIGTLSGINYFDGLHWQTFSKKNVPELAVDSVFSILVRQNHTLLFGMGNGYVYSYDLSKPAGEQWTLISDPAFFKQRAARSMVESDDGKVWVTGSVTYCYDGKKWSNQFGDNRIYAGVKTHTGQLLAIGGKAVSTNDKNSWKILPYPAVETLTSIVEASDGSVFACTKKGVLLFYDNQWSYLDLSFDSPRPVGEIIRGFADGSIWIGTRNGVYLVRESDWSTYKLSPAAKDFQWDCFYSSKRQAPHALDKDGHCITFVDNQWKGLGNASDQYGTADRFLSIRDDHLVIQNTNAILEYNLNSFVLEGVIPIPAEFRKNIGYQTSDGNLWLWGDQGLISWTGNEWRKSVEHGLENYGEIDSFMETRDNRRWIGTPKGEILSSEKREPWKKVVLPNNRGRRITDICLTKDGSLWYATSGNGIFVVNKGKIQEYTTKNGLPNDWILCLCEASDGTVWAGMDDSSVASFRDGRWISFSKKELQLEGNIRKICEDPQGSLWFSLDPSGFIRYTPSKEPPKTLIKDFTAYLTPNGIGVFTFQGWDPWHNTPSSDLVYSWRILDSGSKRQITPWTSFQSNTTVSTPPLSAGNYLLEARAADKERNVDPSPAQVEFVVEPYFFMKTVFWIPLGLFFVLAVILVIIVYKKHKALLESENWLSHAQRVAHVGHWIIDYPRKKLFVSNEIHQIVGVIPKSIKSSYKTYLHAVHPSDLKLVKQTVRDALKNNRPLNAEHRILRPDGFVRMVQLNAEIEFNESNRPVRILGTVQDITEKRRLEEDALRAQKLEAIGVLAGGIAHDFNNLLTSILGNISLAKNYLDPAHKSYQRLVASEAASLRAQELTQKLITFAKGDEPVREITSLVEFIKHTTLKIIENTNCNCEFNIPPDIKLVKIDQRQFSQVLRDLLMNAVQSMPAGGLIRISLENCDIDRFSNLPLVKGTYVKIAISDQGEGIPPESLQKIFDPYFTTKDHFTQKGLGLGLAICFSIIKQHHGFIEAESTAGKGSKFHIYIPSCE